MIEWGVHPKWCRHEDGYCMGGFTIYKDREDAEDKVTRTSTLMWREVGEWHTA